jgi:hypothetical protein
MNAPVEAPASTDNTLQNTGKAHHIALKAQASSYSHWKTTPRPNFQLSRDGVLKLALLIYLGVAIPLAALVLPALRLGADSAVPLSHATEQLRNANPVPDRARDPQGETELANRRSAACVAEKSAETAARLESQGEISHRDKLLFSTPVSEIEHLTPLGRREILSFRKAYGIEQICRDLSPSSPQPGM